MSAIKTQKTEFLCVRPKTSKANNRFAIEMDLLHSCRRERDGNRVFLASISGKYLDERIIHDHWEVIK